MSGSIAAIRWGALGPLLLTAVAIMGTPGPANISLVASGSAYGLRRSLPYLCGVVAGTTIVLVAVATGVTAAVLAVPVAGDAFLAVSAAYLLWLAYHIATAPPLATQTPEARASSLTGGALLGVANPKAWLGLAAVFASAHLARTATADAAAKTAVLTAMVLTVSVVWLVAGSSLAPLLRDPRRSRVVNRVLGATLVGATALAVVH